MGNPPDVVVFSLAECPHCKRAKTSLQELGIVFTEISLTDYPEKRSDMLLLADRLTVPQIFVRGRHIGGNSELQELLAENRLKELLEQPSDAANAQQLFPPDYPPKQKAPIPEAPDEPRLRLGAADVKLVDLQQELRLNVKRTPQAGCLAFSPKEVVIGRQVVSHLQKTYQITAEDAESIAEQLFCYGVLFNGKKNETFCQTSWYRFQVDEVGLVSGLNVARKWYSNHRCISDSVPDPLGTLKRLKSQLSKAVSAFMDSNGGVDYVGLRDDLVFLHFEMATAELQVVDLSTMDEVTRRAFVINLYNMMVTHAFIRLGVPTSDLARLNYFDNARYQLGRKHRPLSLNELENGILRGNRKAPYHLFKYINKNCDLASLVLPVDHRIHFALNCGAKSCPPVKWFSAEDLDEELRIVAMSWVEQDDNVKVDVDSKILYLSKICSWYAEDFGSNQTEIAKTLMNHARGSKKHGFETLLSGGFKVNYMEYDWSTNSKNHVAYTKIW